MLVVKSYKNFRPCAKVPARLTKLTSAALASMMMPGGDFLSLADMGGNKDERVSYSVALIQQALHYGVVEQLLM
jgi:hypothetical protein